MALVPLALPSAEKELALHKLDAVSPAATSWLTTFASSSEGIGWLPPDGTTGPRVVGHPSLTDFAGNSGALARPQLVEHDHERFVRRRRRAVDIEIGLARRAAGLLREDDARLIDAIERDADAAERRKIFLPEISKKSISSRSPWPRGRQCARFAGSHDATPSNATDLVMSIELEALLRNVAWLLSQPKKPAK